LRRGSLSRVCFWVTGCQGIGFLGLTALSNGRVRWESSPGAMRNPLIAWSCETSRFFSSSPHRPAHQRCLHAGRVDPRRLNRLPRVIELQLAQPQKVRQDLSGEIVLARTVMKLVLSRLRIVLVLIVVLVAYPMARAGGERKRWKPDEARTYLDERQKAWFAFSSADRGEGETRT